MKRFLLVAAFFGLLFVTPLSFAKDINVHAYRDIEFGDSPETVVKKVTDDPVFHAALLLVSRLGGNPPIAALNESPPRVTLGGCMFSVYFNFYQDKLFGVVFSEIPPLGASHFLLARSCADTLEQIITKAKGRPDTTRTASLSDIQPDHTVFTAGWNKDPEGVKRMVGIGEVPGGYSAILSLTYVPLSQAWEKAQQEKKKEQINQGAKGF